jgi:hypothetical protein
MIMKTKLKNIKGAQILSKETQRKILGQFGSCAGYDLSLCGCSCSGAVTGPKYCRGCIYCLQVYTCDDTF